MKYILAILSLLMLLPSLAIAAPTVGSVAPEFKLQDQYGKYHALEDYKGQWLVLYFYLKDDTPGCTTEAGKFRDAQQQFIQSNAVVFGISLDNVASHLDFSNTLQLNFSLLADEEKTVSKSYQVLTDFGIVAYSQRETFIIDPEGRIAHHFDDVDPDSHTDSVLKKLESLITIFN